MTLAGDKGTGPPVSTVSGTFVTRVVRAVSWRVLRGRAMWGQVGARGVLPAVPGAENPFGAGSMQRTTATLTCCS